MLLVRSVGKTHQASLWPRDQNSHTTTYTIYKAAAAHAIILVVPLILLTLQLYVIGISYYTTVVESEEKFCTSPVVCEWIQKTQATPIAAPCLNRGKTGKHGRHLLHTRRLPLPKQTFYDRPTYRPQLTKIHSSTRQDYSRISRNQKTSKLNYNYIIENCNKTKK